jgi:hypothetical protein
MVTCPALHPPTPLQADGRNHRSCQRYASRPCGRDFTAASTSLFWGYVDEVFMFRGTEHLYRAVDQHGQVIDVLREHRDLASAEAFLRHAYATSGVVPTTVVSDHESAKLAGVLVAATCVGISDRGNLRLSRSW